MYWDSITDLIDRFGEEPGTHLPTGSNFAFKGRTGYTPGIIIATRPSGQGLTLQHAAHFIRMEVDWVSARYTQV